MGQNAPQQTMSREKIYEKLERINTDTANVAAAVVADGALANTTKSIEVFDSDGASVGFVAVYAAATLT